MLPDFLGIGAPRAGTTWLRGVLSSHPQVFVPKHRKELHFFSGDNYERGLDWYARFFEDARPSQVVGEITPAYLRRPEVPARIQRILPECKFLVMVRNPVDRAFSQFRAQRQAGYARGFEEFLGERRAALRAGLYAAQLDRYLDRFDLDRFLIIVLEQAARRPVDFGRSLGRFLGVEARFFQPELVQSRNRSGSPRAPRLYGRLRGVGRAFRSVGLDHLVERVKSSPAMHVVRSASPAEPLAPDLRYHLWEYFEEDTRRLESLTGLDLSEWRPTTTGGTESRDAVIRE